MNDQKTTTPRSIEVTEVVDSAKFIGLPLGITILTILINLVDGFDLQTLGFVLPVIVDEWGIDRSRLGWVIMASMLGMAVGSVLLGWMGDRIGRKKSYILCLAFLLIGSLMNAYSHNLVSLFIWRFITGIGLGGVTPLATTIISEWSPRHARNVAVACSIVAVPLGGMLGAGIAQWIIPEYGWRMIFFIGAAAPAIFLVVGGLLLPESPKYLAQRPHLHAQLASQLNRLLKQQRFTGTESFHVNEPPAPPENWFRILLRPEYRTTTLLLWAAFAFNTLCLYAFVNWLPTVLTSIQMPLESALQGSKLFNFGGFFGAVGGAFLIGWFGSRLVGSGLALAGSIATVFIGIMLAAGMADTTAGLLLLILVAGTALNGMQAFLYAVGAHSYPTYIRASGVGCAQTVSRIGGVLSSFVGATYFAIKPQPPISLFFYFIAAAIFVVVVTFFSLRTHIPPHAKSLAAAAVRKA